MLQSWNRGRTFLAKDAAVLAPGFVAKASCRQNPWPWPSLRQVCSSNSVITIFPSARNLRHQVGIEIKPGFRPKYFGPRKRAIVWPPFYQDAYLHTLTTLLRNGTQHPWAWDGGLRGCHSDHLEQSPKEHRAISLSKACDAPYLPPPLQPQFLLS